MKMHRILITSVGSNVGQGVAKSLRSGKRKYHIIGIDMDPLSAGLSLVDDYYRVPKTGEKGFLERLIQICRKEKIEAVYVCFPTELDFFSNNKEELEKELGLDVFIPPPEVIRIGQDKLETVKFLERKGFPFPETVLIDDELGLNRLIKRCGWPLIIKPRWGFTSRNVFLVNSKNEISAVRSLIPNLLAQQYLPDSDAEYTAGAISSPDRKMLACIILHRYLNQGTTCKTELMHDAMIVRQVKQIVEALGAIGVCNLQFRIIDGKVFVFEINPRFSGTSGIRYLYGFNEAEMVFELFRLGLKIKQPRLRPAVVLRYWNEVFVSDATFDILRKSGKKFFGKQIIAKRRR